MKTVFVDTSGFYALLDFTDAFHPKAFQAFKMAEAEEWNLITTQYVALESWSLIQKRLGWEAMDELVGTLFPMCEIVNIDEQLHGLGAARCRQARMRHLSLTDCVSFELMRKKNIVYAIAQDVHFERERFQFPL